MSEVTNLRFRDKVAIIGGASGGIGKGLAIALAAEGAQVVIWATNGARLEKAGKEISARGGKVSSMKVNIRDYARVKESVDRVVAQYGKLDIMFPVVGGGLFKPFIDASPEFVKDGIEYNFTTTYNCFHTALPHMVRQQSGRLMCFMSTMGGTPGLSIYGIAKAACRSMIETIAVEHLKDHITVNGLLPGIVLTPWHDKAFSGPDGDEMLAELKARPLGLNTVENVARTALNMLADDRCTGQILRLQ
ncbi:SDR family NAD(P)-dependent oxidoreductase [Chloroflexota bacterium]